MTELINALTLKESLAKASFRILDATWYLPNDERDARTEFAKTHIAGAQFFDIDAVSNTNSYLPHMLPTAEQFAEAVSSLGISNTDQVVVYDSLGLFSAARVWWMFHVFGQQNVQVLNGGLPAWLKVAGDISDTAEIPSRGQFFASLNSELVADFNGLRANIDLKTATVIDARPAGRFNGIDSEPRPNLPSGHIPNSISMPFQALLSNGALKPQAELQRIFSEAGIQGDTTIITSCGSGVTAAIITLALAECGFGLQQLYDGAWAEWGLRGPIA